MKRLVPIALLIVAAIAVGWWFANRQGAPQGLVLYGNVDLRQVDLPFNASERVTAVLAQEGDHVKQGQLLAQLDTTRLQPQVAKAEADVAAQQQAVNRLHAGSRPQEIAQARANVESARADAANARSQYDRLLALFQNSAGRAVSHQDIDSAKAAVDMAEAKLAVNRKALDLTGCRRALAHRRAGRDRLATEIRVHTVDYRPEVDSRLRFGAGLRSRARRRSGIDHGRYLPQSGIRRVGRFYLAGRRIHAQRSANRGAAIQPRV